MIGQILEYNTVVTKAEFLFIIQSVNLPPSAHTITSSAHTLQQPLNLQYTLQPIFSTHCSQSSVHTAANLQYTLQPIFSAHCSYIIQCTLQLYYPVHTAAIPSSAHCSYTIWCQYNIVHPVHLWTTTG